MKKLCSLTLFLFGPAMIAAWSQTPDARSTSNDPIVLQAGNFELTKAEYERLISGFDRSTGANTTGSTPASVVSGRDVARLLALVSEAQRRKIDQDPVIQTRLRVRGYVLLANTLLLQLVDDMKKDEAGTRAFYASEQHNYVEVHARHILVRYKGVKTEKADAKGLTRTRDEAKERAASLYRKIKDGADFAAIARAESDDETTSAQGGDLPYFTRGLMTAEFEATAFALPVGGLGEPIKTEYGYNIIQVLDHRPLPFDKVRAALENMRARQRFEEIGSAGVKLSDSYFKP